MSRTRSRRLGAAALAAALLFTAACSDDDDDGDSAASGTSETTESASETTAADTGSDAGAGDPSESSAPAETPTIATAETDLGTILVDGQGLTLYLFTSDSQGEPSTCSGGCSASWPKVTGEVSAGDGIDESLIGTVEDPEGGVQATYDGWPLYYYAEDAAPGETKGQGSGGVWWVVAPDGTAIEE